MGIVEYPSWYSSEICWEEKNNDEKFVAASAYKFLEALGCIRSRCSDHVDNRNEDILERKSNKLHPNGEISCHSNKPADNRTKLIQNKHG